MKIFCDNEDCCHIGVDGFCGCDKLSIVGGVCEGSMHGGRNASDGDINERLKAENAKLRELVIKAHACKTDGGFCESCYQDEGCCPVESGMEELGIEVDDGD